MTKNENLEAAQQLIRDVRLIEPATAEQKQAIELRGDN